MTPFTKDDCFRTFLSSCSRKLKLIQARALASSNLSRPVLFPEKKKTLLSLNFLFRNIFFQLEKLSALPIYFLIFDESVKFSNFFFTLMQEIQFSSSINFSLFAIYFGAKFSGKRHGLQKSAHASDLLFVASSPSFGSH